MYIPCLCLTEEAANINVTLLEHKNIKATPNVHCVRGLSSLIMRINDSFLLLLSHWLQLFGQEPQAIKAVLNPVVFQSVALSS